MAEMRVERLVDKMAGQMDAHWVGKMVAERAVE